MGGEYPIHNVYEVPFMAAISSSIIVVAGVIALSVSMTAPTPRDIFGLAGDKIFTLIGAVLFVSGFVGWIATVWRSGSGNGSKE
jgi:hypothetical protein